MFSKPIRVVTFLFFILTLSLSGCFLTGTTAPLAPPAAPPAAPLVATIAPAVPSTEAVEAPAPTPTTAITEVPFYQYVPGGEFTMGSKKTDPLAKEDEFPEHPVRLPGFWIFTNEVNNDLYAQCVAAGKCTDPAKSETGPKSHYGDPAFKEFPVVGVTWSQADEFCKFHDAHLPTEAEWEKTARGFFANIFPWGPTEADCSLANISGCVKDTAKVGNYEPGISPFKVRDMAGNVREWVNDWYKTDEYLTAPLFMPTGPESGKMKVVRGGSYLDSARDVRSSARFAYDPLREFDDVGFRCVPNGESFASFCSSSYRPSCSPPRPGKPPDQCNPGVVTGQGGKTSVSISCPNADGFGTVKVTTSESVGGVNVSIDGSGTNCSTGSGKQFTCTGKVPAAGTAVTVEVCTNSVVTFNPDFGIHEVNCETYNLVTSIGDTININETGNNPYFLASMSFIPENIIISNCPDGYSWDSKTHECVKQPGKPPELVPGTEGRCPVGYVLDPTLLCCVPGTPDNGGCDPGYYMSAAAQLCIPIQQNGCPVGYTYDPYWGCMKQVHQGDGGPAGCPDGTHLSTDGKTCLPDTPVGVGDFTCPPGSDYVQGQGCVTSTVGAPPVQCPQNSYYDYKLKMCVGLTQYGCPAGTYLDPNLKQCMPLSGPWTGCPQNYLINPKTGCCIPVPGTDNSDCIGSQDGKGPTPIPGIVANIQGYDPGQSTCPPPADIICAPGYHPNQDATICLPNDCPKGTGPTPNNPNGCFPQGTEPCPPGYEMSNSGLGCVPIMADSIVYQCAPSQYFDPTMGMCLDRTGDCCAQGFYFDIQYKQCLPFPVDQNCPPGYSWDGQTCTPFAQQGANCTSFNLTVPACQTTCPKGYVWNPNKGKCVRTGGGCTNPGPNICATYLKPDQCTAACCTWSAAGGCH